MAGKYIFTV